MPKWSQNATLNDPRCRQVADILPTPALGTQREPKGSQKGAQMDPKWSPNQAKNEQSGAESGHVGQDLDTGLVSGPGSGHVDQDLGIWATF